MFLVANIRNRAVNPHYLQLNVPWWLNTKPWHGKKSFSKPLSTDRTDLRSSCLTKSATRSAGERLRELFVENRAECLAVASRLKISCYIDENHGMTQRKCVSRPIIELSDSDDEADKDGGVIVESATKRATTSRSKDNSESKIKRRRSSAHSGESPVKLKKKLAATKTVRKRKTPSAVSETKKTASRGRKRKNPEADENMGSCVSQSASETEDFIGDHPSGSNSAKKRRKVNAVPENAPQRGYKVKGNAQDRAKPQSDDTAESYMARVRASGVQCVDWTIADFVSEQNNVSHRVAENIVKLLENENTIPFIARYRKDKTQGMEADELRRVKNSYDKAKLIKHRAATIIKEIDNQNKWTPEIHAFINGTKSLNDLEQIHSMFKVTKSTLAERAREIGLAIPAEAVIRGETLPPLSTLMNPKTEGLKTLEQIKNGIVCVLADMINKDQRTFEKVKELRSQHSMFIETKKAKVSNKETKTDKQKNEEGKYYLYENFSMPERNMKPHQILAINRGEARKVLTVKINIPNSFEQAIKKHCFGQYRHVLYSSDLNRELITAGIELALNKSIKPSVQRRTRHEMNERAEIASMDVFADNVKQLLLTSPVRGKVVLGVDPGFRHGCKLAVISEQGDMLDTDTIYPHDAQNPKAQINAEETIIKMVLKHRCSIFALGNGTACRETEVFLANLIKRKAFEPLDVVYAIVDETGASIYSCTPEAALELPGLNVNVVSAVSIARRLQDPMAELVKIEPKHLGVGMYQHDLPEKQLAAKLNEVIMEAVSFVGVDVNTASVSLLKRVAGLGESKAKNIIEWRKSKGPFRIRSDILKVKGIGNKSYEQCAGFIRIMPETSVPKDRRKVVEPHNYLDQTWIHPESYGVAESLLAAAGCSLENLGTRTFIFAVNLYAGTLGHGSLAEKFGTTSETIEVVVKGLTMEKGHDIRAKGDVNMFRKSLTSMDDLKPGVLLTGVVRNITHFGAFVDVGVERSGLIHKTNMAGTTLTVGQRVETKVMDVDKERGRIGLTLIRCV